MRREGFTLIELAVVLTLSAIVTPAAWLAWRNVDAELALARWHVGVADAVRTVYEELALDARGGARVAQDGVAFEGPGGCGRIDYRVTGEAALERAAPDACGGTRTLARGVRALRPVAGGVELELVLALRPDHEVVRVVFLPLAGAR
jgi:prepilin-type N-terminal cleavage/methylation domain-containing protein